MTAVAGGRLRTLRYRDTAALWAANGIALLGLPDDQLPAAWLAAFTLPGALLAMLPGLAARPLLRALVGVLLQATACALALWLVGPLGRQAALACTILPPLGFASARRQDGDTPLALFLGFCVLLVGMVLATPHLPTLLGFAAFGCLSLRCSALRNAYRHSGERMVVAAHRQRTGTAGTSLVVLGTLVAVLAIDRTLVLLPSPSIDGSGSERTATNVRRPGLDDSFVLDGAQGILSDLAGERLVRVRDGRGEALPADLYLRCGFFTVPGLDRWQIGPLNLGPQTHTDSHRLRRPVPRVPMRELEIERFGGAKRFVFVPPDTCSLDDVRDLVVDPLREWVRPRQPDDRPYTVAQQLLPPADLDADLDPFAHMLGLTSLPKDLDDARYLELLQRWRIDGSLSVVTRQLADALARHCRYERRDPSGPFVHALDNFLFAEGDRHGYCMHFASAAALLLRLRGVPCRIGVGLHGGEADHADPTVRTFGSQHAHAWVEIPCLGRGYVIFDPTPPESRGSSVASGGEVADEESSAAASSTGGDVAMLVRDAVTALDQPWSWAAALLLLLAVASWPRRALAPASTLPPAAPAAARSARRALLRLLRALHRAGCGRAGGQTLEQFAAELRKRALLLPEVEAAFAAYQEVRFGGRTFDAERERRFVSAVAAVEALANAQQQAPP